MFFAVALAASQDGCSFFRRGPGTQAADTIIDVRNNGFADVVISVLQGGSDAHRIGTANGNSSETFHVQASLLGSGVLQLIARPIGGRAYRLPAISVTPGDHISVNLENVPGLAQVVRLPPEP